MRPWIIALVLCIFLFILPLQYFIIGGDLGQGIQGAVFRYQMTVKGNSLIPIPFEIGYVASGIYQGKTAVSVILWALGTLVLMCTTILSLIHGSRINRRFLEYIIAGIVSSCMLYLVSCIVLYGPLFSSPSITSLPLGILVMAMFAVFLYFYQDLLVKNDAEFTEHWM